MKVLFLDSGFDETNVFFRKEREKVEGCTSECLYKKTKNRGLSIKIIQAIGVYMFSPALKLIYGNWKKHIDEYDVFIVVARKSAKYAIKYIRKHTNKRVIVWYWNIVTKRELHPEYCRKLGCETWSFDKSDCLKYQMKFGDTYYFPPVDAKPRKNQYGVFFVGINRPGRKEYLDNMGEYLSNHNITYKFNLTAIPTDRKSVQQKFSRRMSYDEVIMAIRESQCVLDLNRENQSGLTLRPLETLFYNKKLITNNKSITKYYAYNKDNTYIIKDANFEGLDSFINKKNVDVSDEVLEYYSFSNWLSRIINGIEGK